MTDKTASVRCDGAGKTGINELMFQKIAQDAKANCPLSKALASVPEIILKATLPN